jgi:superoxide dismutase, Fe-Mn family
MAYELAPLPYDYAALEPFIDAETMKLHHDKHHQAYINNVNAALASHADLAAKSVDDLISNLNAIPEDIRGVVRNNGGGHSNHTMFWTLMGPANTAGIGGAPTGAIAAQISADFGDFDAFKKTFNETTAKQFGSGWGWLVFQGGKLKVVTTPNQDSPLSQGLYPVLGNDVWEHAYYLKHENRRGEYLKGWWPVVNWQEASRRFESSDLPSEQLWENDGGLAL